MADSISEALARIEHKLDLLLDSQAAQDKHLILRSVGSDEHTCPLCQVPVTYYVNMLENTITRMCGCSTGVQSGINLEQFAPPVEPPKGNQDGD